VEDDDGWQEKVDLLLADPVPVVSFTFGLPPRAVISTLRQAGTLTLQAVTSAAEAKLAEEAGVDALVVQGCDSGGASQGHKAALGTAALATGKPKRDRSGGSSTGYRKSFSHK
jgi:nitronate monooxygenase